jgi:hypothetical protein
MTFIITSKLAPKTKRRRPFRAPEARSEDEKTINKLIQTNRKRKLGVEDMSSGEVALMRDSDLVNTLGQGMKECLGSLIQFRLIDILKMKANSCDF